MIKFSGDQMFGHFDNIAARLIDFFVKLVKFLSIA